MNNSEHISKDTEGDAGAAGSTPVPDFSDPIDPSWVQPPTAEKRLSNKAVCEVVRQADRCGHEIFWVTPEELICISDHKLEADLTCGRRDIQGKLLDEGWYWQTSDLKVQHGPFESEGAAALHWMEAQDAPAAPPPRPAPEMPPGELLDTVLAGVVATFREIPPPELAAGLRQAADRLDPRRELVDMQALVDLFLSADRLATAAGGTPDFPEELEGALTDLEGVLDAVEDACMAAGLPLNGKPPAAPHWMEAQDAFLDTDPRVLLKDLIAVAARAGRAVTKISFSVGVEGSWRLVAERAGRGATEVKAESQQRDAA